MSVERLRLTGVGRPGRGGEVERLRRHSSAVGPEIRTAVGDGAVAEVVAVAERVEYRDRARVDAVRTALVAGRARPAELLPGWDVGARVRVRTVAVDGDQRRGDHDDQLDCGRGRHRAAGRTLLRLSDVTVSLCNVTICRLTVSISK